MELPNPARTPTDSLPFTIVVEVDRRFEDLAPHRRDDLINSFPHDAARIHTVHLDKSPLGNAFVYFDSAHTDWAKAGLQALDVARAIGNTWPVAGFEVCRSDLWLDEPFFDHELDGLGDLPEWSAQADPRRCSTVIVEVEPENATTRHLRDDRLTQVLNDPRNVRLSRSAAGRPQVILEQRVPPLIAALSIAKPSITLDQARTITRARSVRADIYRAEIALYDDIDTDVAWPQLPEWRYVTDDGDRTVVVTDLRVRLEGWSIIHTSVDGITGTSDFGFGAVWRDDDGNLNSVCDGDILDAWEAPIPQGSNLDAFVVDGTRLNVDPWDAMTEWLAESMYDQPLGFLIELGPQDYDKSHDSPVVCAQVVFLSDGVLMLRLSKQVLERLSFADYSSDGLALDTWHYDGYFDDCTDGYLFTRDIRLVAQTCTSWFRDKAGFDTADALGCSYRTADELPPLLLIPTTESETPMTDSPLAATFKATKLKKMDSTALFFAIDHEVDHDRVDIATLRYAIEIATAVHLSQTRIGRAAYPVDPYIVHPLRNVLRLVRLGCADTDVLAATALHDTVEDQPENIVKVLGAAQDPSAGNALLLIEQNFGRETARIVAAVTNPPSSIPLTKAEKNAAYAQHVADVITDNKVFLVKYADFIDNAGSVQYLQDDAKRAKLQTKYAPLVPIFVSALEAKSDELDLPDESVSAIQAKLTMLTTTLDADN